MWERLRLQLIKKLGGYTSAQAAIRSIEDDGERLEILDMAVKRLFNTIGPEDILKELPDSTWIFMGQHLTPSERQMLVAQARQLFDSKLWKMLKADTLYQANKMTYTKAKDPFDLAVGKLFHYVFHVIETRLRSMSDNRGVYNLKKR